MHACVSAIMVSSYHKPPHPLFFNTLILFLLLPFSVGMVRGHSFCQFLHFACDGAVVLFEVFGVLQDAVEVLLRLGSMGEGQRTQNTGEERSQSKIPLLISSQVTSELHLSST